MKWSTRIRTGCAATVAVVIAVTVTAGQNAQVKLTQQLVPQQ